LTGVEEKRECIFQEHPKRISKNRDLIKKIAEGFLSGERERVILPGRASYIPLRETPFAKRNWHVAVQKKKGNCPSRRKNIEKSTQKKKSLLIQEQLPESKEIEGRKRKNRCPPRNFVASGRT